MSTEPNGPASLAVERRRWVRWLWLPLVAAVVVVAAWWARHPTDLPSSSRVVSAQVKAGQTLYLGVPVEVRGTRTIEVRDVEVQAEGPAGSVVDTALWACTGGSVSQTTTPEAFCEEWSPAKGAMLRLGGGDQLVLAVSGSSPGTIAVTGIRVDFTDGLQRGSSRVGPRFEVDLLG